MTSKYKMSIVTVVKNDLEAFKKTFQSVMSQSNTLFEYIVINASTNHEIEWWLNNQEAKPHIVLHERDHGIYEGMNKGLALSNGTWIHFLNAGDTYVDNRVLDIMHEELQPEMDLLYSDVYRDYPNQERSVWRQKPPYAKGLFHNICHQALWINKQKHPDLSFDTNYEISADCHLLMNLIFSNKHLKIKYLEGGMVNYHMGGVSQKKAMQALWERESSFDSTIHNPWIKKLNQLNLKRQRLKLWWRNKSLSAS